MHSTQGDHSLKDSLIEHQDHKHSHEHLDTQHSNIRRASSMLAHPGLEHKEGKGPFEEAFLTSSKTAETFLEEITYYVETNNLYSIKSTCYIHSGMPYCPVQVEVLPELSKYYNARYLLQVWDHHGEKVYEKQLNKMVTQWAVNFKYFIWRPEDGDENSEYYHLVDLGNKNSVYLIRAMPTDRSYKYFAYNDNVFYMANYKHIKMLSLVHDLAEGEETNHFPMDEDFATISFEKEKIHGLFVNAHGGQDQKYLLLALETLDCQVSFSTLHLHGVPGQHNFNYELLQYREVVERKNVVNDPIEKFYSIFQCPKHDHKEVQFGIGIRRSGHFDLYYNCMLASASPEGVTIEDAEITFDTIYLKMPTEKFGDPVKVRAIQMSWLNRISYEVAKYDPAYTFENIYFQKIKNHCRIFNSFCLIKTYLILAHGKLISLFHILKQKWIKHLKCHDEIAQLFRQKNELDEQETIILENSGEIQVLKHGHHQGWFLDETHGYRLDGELIEYGQDREDNKWTFFLTKKNNKPKLNVFYHNKMYDLSTQVEKLTVHHNFVFLFSPSEKTEFIIQHGKHVCLYDIIMGENQPLIEELCDFPVVEDIEGTIHSAIRLKEERYMFLVDQHNFYKLDIETHQTKCYKEQNVIGMIFLDDNFLYTLSHKASHNRSSGFRLYDLENVVEKDKDYSYLLTKNIQVGCQGLIDYSKSNERLVFQSSYEAIEIVPILHRNTIAFIGMHARNHYIATRVIGDKFIALDRHNVLTTWSLLSGKVIGMHDVGHQVGHLKNFEVYKWNSEDLTYEKEWYHCYLLKKKTPIEDYDESKFFDPEKLKSHIKNQTSFVKRIHKKFFEFKLIEIVSESEVVDHCSFIHPYYMGHLQYLTFSDNFEYMYERLPNTRQFLYKREPTGKDNEVTWKMVHRFRNVPSDLMHDCQYPFVFSPDYSMFLDVDRITHQFVIRDTMTEDIKYEIPNHLMHSLHEKDKTIANRFTWIDNHTIWYINHEGIERHLDLSNNFAEKQFNFIPMYDKNHCKHHHTILDKPGLEIKDVLNRLIRKYQYYKTIYNLEGRKHAHHLYEELYTIDYRLNECKGMYLTDLSFTYLHWSIMEQLDNGSLTVHQIDHEQVRHLFYNILPGGDTVLHKLFKHHEILAELCEIAHPNKENRKEINIHIPFLKNLDHKSPIHLCQEHKDYRAINMFLDYLSGYGIDHHSRTIVDELHFMIEHKMPNFLPYLDSRLQQTEHVATFKKGLLKENELKGMVAASFCFEPEDKDRLFAPAPIEQEIRLEFIDIPKLHTYLHKSSKAFFSALADTENMVFFEKKVIKKLIDFKWQLAYEYILKLLFYPFMVYLLSFMIYMHQVQMYKHDAGWGVTLNYTFYVILSIFSVYFLKLELYQLFDQGFEYLLSIWNYIDLTPPILIFIHMGLDLAGSYDDNQDLEAILHSTMTLFMWLKFLYFLRIFPSTGYLIRIIFEVASDMKYFLFILILIFMAFGDALYQINVLNPPDSQFIFGGWIGGVIWVYLMALGSFTVGFQGELGTVTTWWVWILFLISTLFIMIILLNLLIAIISEAFTRIYEVSNQASYQEKAGLIAENSYLIPASRRKSYVKENKYLLIATDIEEEMLEDRDPMDLKLEDMKHKMSLHLEEKQKHILHEVHELHKESRQEFLKMMDENAQIKAMVQQLLNKN